MSRTRSLPLSCIAFVLGIGACVSSSNAPTASQDVSAADAMTGDDGGPASSSGAASEGGSGSESGSVGGGDGGSGSDGDAASAGTVRIRVAAGASSPYTDPSGNVWSADTGFSGGLAAEATNQAVQGTSTPTLYDGQRYGDGTGFSYAFALPAGAYDVTLKFTENYVTGAGQRLFDVAIGGKTVLSGFDIFAQSGGTWRALDETFPVTMPAAGTLKIDFIPGSAQNPKVDAIAIVPAKHSQDAGAGSDAGSDAAGGIGPAASSTFVTADFTDTTSPAGVPDVVVVPQLFGASTGGLANGSFSALSNATTRSLIRALNLPLLRLNANYTSPQTSASIAPLVAHALDVFPSDCTWIVGVDSATSATDVASYLKANSPIACNLWEVHNETQPGQSSSSYDSDALAIAAAVRAIDPSYRIAGDVSAGLDIGDLKALVGATDSSSLGLLDFHDYLYCAGGSTPSNAEVCLARRPGQTSSTAYADDQLAVQSAVAGTFAASLPVLLGEYNVECSASFSDLRAGTSVGAAFMVSATLSMAAVSTQPVWSAVWDLFDDGGANYNLIDASNNLYPQYYTLQRLISTMPGAMVSTVVGSTGGGLQAWATKSGAHFGVAIVNSNSTAATGPVALSHWPVDASGTGSATLWAYPQGGSMTTPLVNTPGNVTSVAVNAGLTDPITVPAQSVAILSYP